MHKNVSPFPDLRTLLVAGAFLMILSCDLKTKNVERYENGSIKKQWTQKKNLNGQSVKHGILRTWFESGQIESSYTYRDGKMHGQAAAWYPSGWKRFEGVYQDNLLIKETQWDETGKEAFKRNYKVITTNYPAENEIGQPPVREKFTVFEADNTVPVRHGTSFLWHRNGSLKSSCDYEMGRRHGSFSEWDQTGTKTIEGYYQNDLKTGQWLAWYPDSRLKSSMQYADGKKEGMVSGWHPNGILEKKCFYENDTLTGLFQTWYANGQPEEIRKYDAGRQAGFSKKWYPSGQLNNIVFWKDNAADGEAREWYESGNLRSLSHYKAGLHSGPLEVYYDNGKKFLQASYADGKLHGPFSWWTENGTLISEREYVSGHLFSDSRIPKVRAVLNSEDIRLPMHFHGFVWGMTPDEISANIRLYNGTVINRSDSTLHAAFQLQESFEKIPVNASFSFNKWQELWEMQMDFPNPEGNKFSYFTKWVEEAIGSSMGVPEFKKPLEQLPGFLGRQKSWGRFRIVSRDSSRSSSFPVIRAELFSYDNRDGVTFLFQNMILNKYASEAEGVLEGPYYDKDDADSSKTGSARPGRKKG